MRLLLCRNHCYDSTAWGRPQLAAFGRAQFSESQAIVWSKVQVSMSVAATAIQVIVHLTSTYVYFT